MVPPQNQAEILTVVFHWGSVFVSVSDMSVCHCYCVNMCVYDRKSARERESTYDRQRERRETRRVGEDKQRAEKGVSPVGLWVIQSTQ